MTAVSTNASISQGSTLPTMSSPRRMGETMSCSNVPWSRSFTSETAVCWMVTIMMMTTMSPG